MVASSPASRITRRVGVAAVAALIALTVQACGDSSTSPTQQGVPTGFRGALANDVEAGVVDVSVAASGRVVSTFGPASVFASVVPSAARAAAARSVSGTLKLVGGASITLTGTFDPATGALHLSGSGYTLDGTYSKTTNSVTGSYTGPHGSGSFSLGNSSGGAVKVLCGSYTIPNVSTGKFEVVITSDNKVYGLAIEDETGDRTYLRGTVTQSGSTTTISVVDADHPDAGLASGTVTTSGNVTSVSGTITGAPGSSFSGSTASCGA
jgi:hypothetical protein